MFHRALGPTPPRDALMDRFNITYVTLSSMHIIYSTMKVKTPGLRQLIQVQCGDLELEKEINDRVDEFCVHLHDSRESSGQVFLSF